MIDCCRLDVLWYKILEDKQKSEVNLCSQQAFFGNNNREYET